MLNKHLIFLLILILLVPNISISGVPQPESIGSIATMKSLFTGVESFEPHSYKYMFVRIRGENYIDLGHGLLYPISNVPVLKSFSAKDFKVGYIPNNYFDLKIPLILKYNSKISKVSVVKLVRRFGGVVTQNYSLFPFVAVKIPLENVSSIYDLGLYIEPMVDYKVNVELNESIPMIKPPNLWKQLEEEYGSDINGTGITIGILDTGIFSEHPDFYFPNGTSKIRYSISFVSEEAPNDGYGHGTHVAGIAAGTGLASDGKFRGVAPGALLANIKVLANNGSGYISWIIKGIEFAINKSIDVINLSLGGGSNGVGDDPLSIAVDKAVEKGVVVVVAAGNDGPFYSTLGSPAISRKAITVGSIEKNRSISLFSSRGPTGDLRIKPDVLAPGSNIVAPLAESSFIEKFYSERYPDQILNGEGGRYVTLSGTSMAAPHVAGVVALVLQVHKDYTSDMVKAVITSTAKDLKLDLLTQGLGVVNAYYAVTSPLVILNPTGSITQYSFDNNEISFEIREVNGVSHDLNIIEYSLFEFYSKSNLTFSNYISIVDFPRSISPNEVKKFKVRILNPPFNGLYLGYIKISVDNRFNLSLGISYASLTKLILNVTSGKEYIDSLFVLYRHRYPYDFILPNGYEYLSEKPLKYFAWFYLPPGEYSLFTYGINIDSNIKYFESPLYIATRNINVGNNIKTINLSMDVLAGRRYDLLRVIQENNTSIPFSIISSIITPSNSSFTAYLLGLWNINKSSIYLSLLSGDKVYLNTQFAAVPEFFSEDPYNGLNHTLTYYSVSWLLVKNPNYLTPFKLSKYILDSSSSKDNDLGYIGLAVFPPGQLYTFLMISPFYQGAYYEIYISEPIQGENIGVVYFDTEATAYRSISMLDPRYDRNRYVRAVSPPFTPLLMIFNGVASNIGEYLNITSAMSTSLDPLNILYDGNSSIDIYFNGELVYHEFESSDFNFIGKSFIPLEEGIYEVSSSFNMSYPISDKTYVFSFFNTSKMDYTPPIPYSFNIPPIVGKNTSFSIEFLENYGIKLGKVYISWDGKEWKEVKTHVSFGRLGSYTKVRLNGVINSTEGDFMSIKILIKDTSNNYVNITIFNVSKGTYKEYSNIPELYTYPQTASPKDFVSFSTFSYNNVSYGATVYKDRDIAFNILYNGSTKLEFNRIFSFNEIGTHNISLLLRYNILKKPVKILKSVTISYLELSGVDVVNANKWYVKDNSLFIYLDLGRSVEVLYDIRWIHNSSPAYNSLIIINSSLINVSNDGYAHQIINYSNLDRQVFFLNKVTYVSPKYGNTIPGLELNLNKIVVIWDSVIFELVDKLQDRYPLNKDFAISLIGYYKSSGQPFNGSILINNETVVKSKDGIFKFVIRGQEVGKVGYKITEIVDNKYNLTHFKFSSVEILFDDLILEPSIEYDKGLLNVSIVLNFAYDSTPVIDAKVYINDTLTDMISPGLYRAYIKPSISEGNVKIRIKASYALGKSVLFEKEATEYKFIKPKTYGINILIIILAVFAIIVIITFAILYFKRK